MKVAKWGNSLAVRLPAELVETLKLKEGDEIELGVAGARAFAVERKMTREEAIKSLRKYRGTVPADYKFDRDEANER
jgi:antitoxin MazE